MSNGFIVLKMTELLVQIIKARCNEVRGALIFVERFEALKKLKPSYAPLK